MSLWMNNGGVMKEQMKRQLIFLDFEVFAQFWCVTFALPYENRVVQIWNDREEFLRFYNEHKDDVYVGYNIKGYDQWIFKALVAGFDTWSMNKHIIEYGKQGWTFSDALRKIKLNIFDVIQSFRSLKELEGFMLDDIRETTVDFRIERELTDEEIEEVLFYNRHDVLETMNVFEQNHLLKKPNDMAPLLHLLNMYHLPISSISKTNAQLTTEILGAERQEYNDEWDLQIPDNLIIKENRFVLDWYKNPKNRYAEAFLNCEIYGMDVTFGWGGVHGSVNGIILRNKAILDCDISSMYPNIMIEYNLLSRSIPRAGRERFKEIVKTRIEAKKKGDKNTANALKICINALYGISRDKTSAVYDPRNGISVCVVGQLVMLDLLEKLHQIPSVVFLNWNTDGIFLCYDNTDETFDRIDEVTREWEKRTRLTMEFDDYKDIYQANVNNYVAISADGDIHAKGALFKAKNRLDNDMPIIREAIYEYVVNGVPIETTIYSERMLWKFQKIVKLSSNYRYVTRKVKTINGKTVCDDDGLIEGKTFRIFASTDVTDAPIYKVKSTGAAMRWGDTPMNVFIVNEDVKNMPCPDKLDREYYIRIAYQKAKAVKDLDSLF